MRQMTTTRLTREHRLPPGVAAVEKRWPPIRTVIVDSSEFDRITQSVQGAIQAPPHPDGQATTFSTVSVVKNLQPDSAASTARPPKTPESKPALSVSQVTSQGNRIMVTSFHTSAHHHPTTKPQSHHGSPTTTAPQKSSTGDKGVEGEDHNIGGIIIGFVAAGITTAVICLIMLFFFCRHKRKREVRGANGERRKGLFGRGTTRSASQNSGESRRKLLLNRNLTRGSDEKPSDSGNEDTYLLTLHQEPWKPNDAVHYPPYQHIPRTLRVDAYGAESREQTSRAASPSSAETPLPDMPTRPPTLEIRSPPLNHRPSLPIELRTIVPTTPPIVGLTRPKTAYGPNAGPSRYSLLPANSRGSQRNKNKMNNKDVAEKADERGYALNTLESPEFLPPPSRRADAASTCSNSQPPSASSSRQASPSKKNTASSRLPASRRGSVDESAGIASSKNCFNNLPALVIPSNKAEVNAPRPSVSRTNSYNSLREDASGIPMVWTNVDQQSPKASPTVGHEQAMELNILPSQPPSRRATSTMQLEIPESPIDGTMNSVSTTNSSILHTFSRVSNPLPIPDKSPLRGISPGPSVKSISPPHTRAPSPCPTDDSNEPTTPVRMRRRNTGYRPAQPLSQSPPPALPALPLAPIILTTSAHGGNTTTRPSSCSTMQDSLPCSTPSIGTWSQTTTSFNANRTSTGRPHSYSATTTRSSILGLKDGALSRFSFSPIQENRASLPVPGHRASMLSLAHPSAEEAVDSFFQATQAGQGTETARPSFEELEETEPQLARIVSITSTSGSCRTTIEFKPSVESQHSRMLSRSTIRTMDMHYENMEQGENDFRIGSDFDTASGIDTRIDMDDMAATYISSTISRTNSSASSVPRTGRHQSLRNVGEPGDTNSATYSPTLSMLNFYSSRDSIAAAPPSSRSSLAMRRNSQVPNISIPQPQLYIHPNNQLEIAYYEEDPALTIPTGPNAHLLSAETAGATGSLSSATSPVSFTTADSSSASSSSSISPRLNSALDIGAPVSKHGSLIPIPTPQIYSSSTEDLSPDLLALQLQRQPSYLAFPKPYYEDPDSPSLRFKPSVDSLAATDNQGTGRLELHTGSSERNISLGTESTLDKSSFRDADKSSSGLHESSSDEGTSSGASDAGDFDQEINACGTAGASTVDDSIRRKRKRSAMFSGFEDDRGRLRERRLL
ncbi:hypothetical protein Dda_4232 [Drechslerella dactyloides]|uniref:Uncharacterized protein n=1 Tax=Drechslerella dactyloides TaxID=74499 RepID=A0AAD6NKJ7_DREDA|nr:hypothetical protein Dda_4232 [Drechslerella dactyloides]